MRVELLVGVPAPEKVWDDGILEVYINQTSDGNVWFHQPKIDKVTKEHFLKTPISMLNFFEEFKKATGVDKLYAVTPRSSLKWAVHNGWEPLYDALVDGKEMTVLEYTE